MSKKVLIMSASTGGGHNRAARAIKEELESRTINDTSIECEIVDSLKLVNNTMDKLDLSETVLRLIKIILGSIYTTFFVTKILKE